MTSRYVRQSTSVLLIVANPCALAHTNVTAEQARDLVDSTNDLVVVDVRERYEYCDAIGHIPGALNYPWNSGLLQARYEELPMQGPVLVVCRGGGRSNQAANFLDSKGFSMVYDMLGGMSAWLWETAPCKYGGGSGTEDDPYQIATAEDLMLLGDSPEDYDKHFILTADIDLDPNLPGRKVFDKAVIAPEHTYDHPESFGGTSFFGCFDGNGYVISNLQIQGSRYLGLFGRLGSGSKISNLGLEAVDVNGTGNYVGGLVGYNRDDGKIANCYSNSRVAGETHVGGFVGYNDAIIFTCYSTGSISGTAVVGGLVGDNTGIIINSYARGSVSGNSIVGGFVGSNEYIRTLYASGNPKSPGEIFNCYSTSSVSGNEDVGGLVGSGSIREVFSSFWDINTSGQTFSAGGSGKTTTEMQNIQTYLDANWDFVGETENGLHENWQIAEEGGYPTLAMLSGYIPPQLRGQGTHEEPYLISDARELGAIIHYSPYAHYRLTASIDLSEIRWGMAVVPWFAGTFDGNDLTISHLTIIGQDFLGLFGELGSAAEVKDLGIEDANIVGTDYFGSLAATNKGSIKTCYSTGEVSGNNVVGGLVGINRGSVTTSYSTSAVTGSLDVGGLVGNNWGDLNGCYNTGMVSGNSSIGGVVGYNCSAVTDCYSESAVSGDSNVGGLVGFNTKSITKSYSTGPVTGTQYVGGMLGRNLAYYTHCFWDIETSGQTTSAGGTGKTTTEMQIVTTFLNAGWDFVGETTDGTDDIWWILEGQDYPRLWWQLPSDDFGDGQPGPLWFVYAMEPELAWLQETNGRLEVNTTGLMEDVDAIYVSDGWRLDATRAFAVRVDFHFGKVGVGDGRLTLGLVPTIEEPVVQWAQFEAGTFDDNPFYLYEVRDGTWVEEKVTNRFSDDGTLYVSYDPDTDELYFSYTGYEKANAWQTVSGLVRGRWQSESVYITLGGGCEGMALTGEDAWLDNFTVDTGSIL